MFHRIFAHRAQGLHNYQECLTIPSGGRQIFFIVWNPHGTTSVTVGSKNGRKKIFCKGALRGIVLPAHLPAPSDGATETKAQPS